MPDNLRDHIKDDISEQGLWPWVRTNILTGLLVAGPLVVAWWVFWGVIIWVDNLLLGILPDFLNVQIGDVHGLGLLGGIVFLLVIGVLARNYFGMAMLGWLEKVTSRIPVVRSIFSAAKKVADAVSGQKGGSFRQSALVQYPREGMWSVGFITGGTLAEGKRTLVGVFVPSAPSPTNGFVVWLLEKEIVRAPMSVDDAWKLVLSGGIVVPDKPKAK